MKKLLVRDKQFYKLFFTLAMTISLQNVIVCAVNLADNVMIGGSSSFDIVPGKYGKLNAIRRYLAENDMHEQEIVYCGDDYSEGGNDYDVYAGGIPFVKVDHYDRLRETLQENGLL